MYFCVRALGLESKGFCRLQLPTAHVKNLSYRIWRERTGALYNNKRRHPKNNALAFRQIVSVTRAAHRDIGGPCSSSSSSSPELPLQQRGSVGLRAKETDRTDVLSLTAAAKRFPARPRKLAAAIFSRRRLPSDSRPPCPPRTRRFGVSGLFRGRRASAAVLHGVGRRRHPTTARSAASADAATSMPVERTYPTSRLVECRIFAPSGHLPPPAPDVTLTAT